MSVKKRRTYAMKSDTETKFVKKRRTNETRSEFFELLHDDIVLYILCKLSSTASSPSDFIAVRRTCKRFNKLGVHPLVLSKSCSKALAVRAKNWCPEAHQFLKLCVSYGNIEAYYTLGMILFYCLQNRASGASMLAKAAVKLHAPSLYSLALIQFNGSGGLRNDKDLRAGFALCCKAASLGHIDALRELGHCFQDGYGVRKNVPEGRRILVQANAREVAYVLRLYDTPFLSMPSAWRHYYNLHHHNHCQQLPPMLTNAVDFEFFSDYGVNLSEKETHPANKFMVEWFGSEKEGNLGQDLRMCSYDKCGRAETRKNEFRRCSGCGKVNYCSRGCQAHDWRVHHKAECAPMDAWIGHAIDEVEEEDNMIRDVGVIDDQQVQNEES